MDAQFVVGFMLGYFARFFTVKLSALIKSRKDKNKEKGDND